MSGALSAPLADAGPVQLMTAALQARLQWAFPPTYFDFAFMPFKADRRWFERCFRRCAGVALSWRGCEPTKSDAVPFTAHARFTVVLFAKNAGGVQQRYVGDGLGVGLFSMTRIATLALQGWTMPTAANGWEPQGAVIVDQVGNLYDEQWGDENTAIAGLDLSIEYEEVLPPGFGEQLPDGVLVDNIFWNFGQQPPLLNDTIPTGANI